MTLYAQIFSGERVLCQITISPRSESAENLLYKHTSKKGFISLVFSPRVGILFQGKSYIDGKYVAPNSILFSATMMPTIVKAFTIVMGRMKKHRSKLYVVDENNHVTMDKALSKRLSESVATYGAKMIIRPDIFDSRTGWCAGISIYSDQTFIGVMSYDECESFLVAYEKIDLTTYQLIASVAERCVNMDEKLDLVLQELRTMNNNIELLLDNRKQKSHEQAPSYFSFNSLEPNY